MDSTYSIVNTFSVDMFFSSRYSANEVLKNSPSIKKSKGLCFSRRLSGISGINC